MSNMAISIEHVSKAYHGHTVLRNVSVTFEQGMIHGVIGRNGSGKTQLFKTIAGYVTPDSGKVTVWGKQIGKGCTHPDGLGILIETPGFLQNFTGLFNLQMLAAMNTQLTRAELCETRAAVGLQDATTKKVNYYSLGMRQRLGIAQAIMGNPKLIILDEPFNGLDHMGVAEIRQLLLRCKESGKTILLASHYAEDIDLLCDTVHTMEAGVISRVKG